MKTKQIAIAVLVAFAIGFGCGFAISRKYSPCIELPVVNIQRDTVTVRDTIRGVVPKPREVVIKRVDTVRLQINPVDGGKFQTDTNTRRSIPDTTRSPRINQQGQLEVPIEQKVYKTADYRAVVSGWRPSLDSMEVYAKRTTITETVTKVLPPKPKRWALVVGGGAGYGPDQVLRPVLAATFGLVIIGK